jgi:hypothetical protein
MSPRAFAIRFKITPLMLVAAYLQHVGDCSFSARQSNTARSTCHAIESDVFLMDRLACSYAIIWV